MIELSTLYEIAKAAFDAAQRVNANNAQCKLLAERVLNISQLLKTNIPSAKLPQHQKSLQRLQDLFQKAKDFIKSFEQTNWFMKIFNGKTHGETFQKFDEQLKFAMQELGLSVNLDLIFAQQALIVAERADAQAIQAQLDTIIQMQQQQWHGMHIAVGGMRDSMARRLDAIINHLDIRLSQTITLPSVVLEEAPPAYSAAAAALPPLKPSAPPAWLIESTAAEIFQAEPLYQQGITFEKAKNYSQAAAHYQAAAAIGHIKAKTNLATFFRDSQHGVAQDLEEHFSLLQAAADEGHVRAMYNLAECYRKGFGIGIDLVAAKDWLEKVAASTVVTDAELVKKAKEKLAKLSWS